MIVVPAQHELHEKDLLTVESAQRGMTIIIHLLN